ncbi:hypothetical protein V7S43_018703 [Phytophthora oleae]|uniref:Uncharacterized protein n=1 Tax=Phytophthora oleae TaxID=2107226 RepID=A0ABD3ETY3_9STRA
MAFFLVLKHKKNVLMYRRVITMGQFDCLLYLGYHDGQFVYFGLQAPESELAMGIYKELCARQGISNVWLLLDGFRYESIPNRLSSFRMLATSQQSDLKESELEHAYRCLLPCWKKQDLFKLGKKVYDFDEEDMVDRYYFSGGSVRIFTKETFIDIREAMSIACTHVESALALSSGVADIQAGQGHVDRVRHTFVVNTGDPDDYVDSTGWEQIIDSEFAFLRLSVKLRSNELLRFFHWARSSGHGALAGKLFEICLHRLAADNDLILHVSEYDLPTYRRPDEERYFGMKQLEMKKGRAFCSDTASQATSNKTEGLQRNKSSTSSIPKDLQKELEEWRDSDEFSYWYPLCDNFPNIDSIVKLEPRTATGKKGGVAYLQITIADTHSIDGKQLENLKEIFDVEGADPPIYIVLCSDLDSSKKISLTPRTEVDKAQDACTVCKGYYEETPLAVRSDGPRNNVPRKENIQNSNYNLRPSKRARENSM